MTDLFVDAGLETKQSSAWSDPDSPPSYSSNNGAMNALSRREEDTLVKATKTHALKECDPLVKEFAECATGRTISVAWACKSKYKEVQECISRFTGPENMKVVREEYLRLRDQPKQDTLAPAASS